MIRIFVSSVQKELAEERRAVKNFIQGDPLLRRFVADVFLFEDNPASDRQPDNTYLTEVEQRDIYIALFGNEYGWKNANGKSPTELEFDHATQTGRERLVFVKGDDDKIRLTLKGSRAPKAVLQNFKLLRDGKPTNAAILLFGKDPRRFFNNIQVHCLHFLGSTEASTGSQIELPCVT